MTAKKAAKPAASPADNTDHAVNDVGAGGADAKVKKVRVVTAADADTVSHASTAAVGKTAAKSASKVVAADADEGSEPKKRGRKPKAAETEAVATKVDAKKDLKKAAFDEVDVADIEADLEGEPEVVEEAGSEDKPKAKPLRMKVSRAKDAP